jgi:hypothetical protein
MRGGGSDNGRGGATQVLACYRQIDHAKTIQTARNVTISCETNPYPERRPAASGRWEQGGDRPTCTGLDLVRCLTCSAASQRAHFQEQLIRLNAAWTELDAIALPDDDADLDHLDFSGFVVPPCGSSVLKPDVVIFGESVPRDQVARWPNSTSRTPTRCSSLVPPLWSIRLSFRPDCRFCCKARCRVLMVSPGREPSRPNKA